MIKAVIQHKKDTLVVELPRANTDLQIKLLSIGVRILPQNIKLFGGENAEIDVQLASSSRVGQHLCRLFNTENSLGDVNTTAYLVQTADESIKTDLEHDIYYDQYSTAAELINDIKDRTLALGPVKMSLCFPLTGNIDEGDGNPFTVGDSFLYDYRYAIDDLIEEYQNRDVEISYAASVAHPKAAIQIRNREMVDRADLVLCAIERQSGGAWQTIQYAMKQEKPVINLFDEPDE